MWITQNWKIQYSYHNISYSTCLAHNPMVLNFPILSNLKPWCSPPTHTSPTKFSSPFVHRSHPHPWPTLFHLPIIPITLGSIYHLPAAIPSPTTLHTVIYWQLFQFHLCSDAGSWSKTVTCIFCSQTCCFTLSLLPSIPLCYSSCICFLSWQDAFLHGLFFLSQWVHYTAKHFANRFHSAICGFAPQAV